jgi:hypothetical protein
MQIRQFGKNDMCNWPAGQLEEERQVTANLSKNLELERRKVESLEQKAKVTSQAILRSRNLILFMKPELEPQRDAAPAALAQSLMFFIDRMNATHGNSFLLFPFTSNVKSFQKAPFYAK